jgi:hypothetical protein
LQSEGNDFQIRQWAPAFAGATEGKALPSAVCPLP